MSTGNDTQDFRVLTNLDTGLQLVGTYWSRVWNGGDEPPSPRPTNLYPPRDTNLRAVWTRPPKRARRRGEHDYHMTLVSSNNPVGSYTSGQFQKETHSSTYEGLAGSVVYTSRWTAEDDYKLISKLKEKIMGSDFNPAVAAAESNESIQTILSVAKALDKAFRQAKKGNLKGALSTVTAYEKGKGRKVPTQAHLTYQYAIKPMVTDVYDAAQTLAHFNSTPFQQTYTVTREITGVVSSASPGLSAFSAHYGSDRVKIKAIVREVDVPGLLGLTNPASIVWEKIPYSFVADWFVPVGQYLDARGLAMALSGTFVTTRTTRWGAATPKSVAQFVELDFPDYRKRFVSVDRVVSSDLFVPTPSIRPLSKVATWSHAASYVSLFVQRHG